MSPLSCLCGRIILEVARPPDHVNACNCTACSKTGALWAYYPPADVAVHGATEAFSRADKGEPNARFHFCPVCGSTTHFRLAPAAVARFGDTLMGVNMRLAARGDLAGVELRYPDGRAWAGEGPFGYVRPPHRIGDADVREVAPGG